MKQLSEIVDFYEQFPKSEREMALAFLFKSDGSSYRKTGARMLVHLSGEYAGGISGGCLETDVQKKAKLNLMLGQSEILTFNTSKKSNSSGSNLGCDGQLEILLCPIRPDSINNPVEALKNILHSRKPEILCTVVKSFQQKFDALVGNVYSPKQLQKLIADHKELQSLNSICDDAFNSGLSKIYSVENQLEIIAEFIPPKIKLIVVGGHRDVIAMVNMATILGWEIVVCGRKNSLLSKSIQQIETSELNSSIVDAYTAIVFMTHDFDADVKNLPSVIDSDAFYIGTLGPEKRKLKLLKAIDRIESASKIAGPIGLNLGSKSPEEIALATCAEIQQVFSQQKNIHLTKSKISDEIKSH